MAPLKNQRKELFAQAVANGMSGTDAYTAIISEPPKRRLLIGIGGDAAALEEDMIDVDFKLWVAGEDLPIEQLKGQLGLGLPSSRRPRARPQLKVQPRQ